MHYDLSYLSNLVTLCELETYDQMCHVSFFKKRIQNEKGLCRCPFSLFVLSRIWLPSICKEFMDITASLQLQVCKCIIKTFMFCLLTEYTRISEEERV